MFKKILSMGMFAFCLSVNIHANIIQETPKEDFCKLETQFDQEELTLFGIYNKTFYTNIIKELETLKQNAMSAIENLTDFEKKLKTEEADLQRNENQKTILSSPETMRSFQTFLKQQETLDTNIFHFLSLLGFVANNSEINAEKENLANTEQSDIR